MESTSNDNHMRHNLAQLLDRHVVWSRIFSTDEKKMRNVLNIIGYVASFAIVVQAFYKSFYRNLYILTVLCRYSCRLLNFTVKFLLLVCQFSYFFTILIFYAFIVYNLFGVSLHLYYCCEV